MKKYPHLNLFLCFSISLTDLKKEHMWRADKCLYDYCQISLRLLTILSFRLTISCQEVLIAVIYRYSRYQKKVEYVDVNGCIFAVLVISNCAKICTKIGSFCCNIVLYLKKKFEMGLLISVSSAKRIIIKGLFQC